MENMIKTIEIENVKGIKSQRFELNIIPNKPSLLVAPNGFGKSSLAIGFQSMQNHKSIKLDKKNYYKHDENKKPKITIEYNSQNKPKTLVSTDKINEIGNEIDYFVINNIAKPKGIGSQYGRATARLEIEDVVLFEKIPKKVEFNYQYSRLKNNFGCNGKILPDLQKYKILSNTKLIQFFEEKEYSNLRSATEQRKIQQKIADACAKINKKEGNEKEIIDWIKENVLQDLQDIEYLKEIAFKVKEFSNCEDVQSYLTSIELICMFKDDKDKFKNACTYNNYLAEKKQFEELLLKFNSTWEKIETIKAKY